MKKVNVEGLSMESTNKEIFAAIGGEEVLNNNFPIVYAIGESSGGNKSVFVIQKVKTIGLAESEGDVNFAALSFAENRDRIVRAITTVRTESPIAAGDILDVAQILLTRNTTPFANTNAEGILYPSNIVLNPTTGLVSAIQGQPIFEHREVITNKKRDASGIVQHDFSALRVQGDTDTTCTREDVYNMLISYGVESTRAYKAAQMDFSVEKDPIAASMKNAEATV